MGLLIYRTIDPSTAFSYNDDFTNPLVSSFDGITGGIINRKYYIRNDNINRAYSGITVKPVYSSGVNIIDGTDGFYWKLIAGDQQPLEEQWSLVDPANQINIPNIGSILSGDISTYEPFWLRIVVPKGAPVQSVSGIKLRVEYTEIIVSP